MRRRAVASIRNAEAGFTLIEALFTLGLVSVLLLALTQFADFASNFQRINNAIGTQEKMRVVRSAIMQAAQDVDGDGYYEILVPDAGTKIPASLNLGGYTTDEWGTTLLYCPYDIGNTNSVNTAFVSNSPAYASDHALGTIVSAGKDKSFQTTCADVSAQGDDLAAYISESDTRYARGGIGGFAHQSGEIKPITQTDNINLQKSLLTVGNYAVLPTVDPQGRTILPGTMGYQSADSPERVKGLYVHDGLGMLATNWKSIANQTLKFYCSYGDTGSGLVAMQNVQYIDATKIVLEGQQYAGYYQYSDPFGLETCWTYISYTAFVQVNMGFQCAATCTNGLTQFTFPTAIVN